KCQSLLDFFRTKNFVASSAAALVSERRYSPTHFQRQHTFSQNLNKTNKPLIYNGNLPEATAQNPKTLLAALKTSLRHGNTPALPRAVKVVITAGNCAHTIPHSDGYHWS
ncbi:hypothetical protein, partial [Neorhizobium lilium]|uniref:hypothetical protein n=1 Tax=Neorhizobium lilium TaxID=2503024 RepID=UPI00197E4BFD